MSWHGARRASRKGLGASGQEALNPKKINQSGSSRSRTRITFLGLLENEGTVVL